MEKLPEKTLSIIIPALNEVQTIAATILDYFSVYPKAYFLVIDNGSADNTAGAVKQVFKENNIKGQLVTIEKRGKANALKHAFRVADTDLILLTDGDLTYPAKDSIALVKCVESDQADMATGNRISGGNYKRENKRPFHNFCNRLVVTLVNRLFRAEVEDVMTGLRVMNRRFVKSFPLLSGGFEIETEMTLFALAYRFRMIEVPINYIDRPSQSFSKLSTFKDGPRVTFLIFRLFKDYYPSRLFGPISLVFFFIGFLFSLAPMYEFLIDRHVYGIASAVVAGTAFIAGIQTFLVALLLDSVARSNRQVVEIMLNSRDL